MGDIKDILPRCLHDLGLEDFSHGCQASSERMFAEGSNGFALAVATASFASLTFLAALLRAFLEASMAAASAMASEA